MKSVDFLFLKVVMESVFLIQDAFSHKYFQETCSLTKIGDCGAKIRLPCSAEKTAPEGSQSA